MAKKVKKSTSITNRRARFDYALEEGFCFGVVLNGRQVRAIRTNHVSLRGSYLNLKNSELWLVGCEISLPASVSGKGEVVTSREDIKLLATRQDLKKIEQAKKSGRTIVPTEILNRTRYIKLKAAIGRGKKEYDKREVKKKREFDRQAKRELRNY